MATNELESLVSLQKQKLNSYAAPTSLNIALEDIVRVREFRANRGVGWEGKFGFTIKYRYANIPPAIRSLANLDREILCRDVQSWQGQKARDGEPGHRLP
jgi:hypothetical protein